ncbi:MAG: right-handed parallel beta-helix repeat-containing protein [Verrucomicrobiales bacterium]|nr:right-handed parallel beta-helix repeat-containing protein [Verrucomicrobiales bacterium]
MSLVRWLMLLLASLAWFQAGGAEWYVSPTGSNGSPGTLAQPWATLTYAASQLVPGDTLHVRGGTYSERLILNGESGTAAQRISILAYNGETPVIDGTALTVPSGGDREGLVEFNDCSYLTFEGITVRNFKTTAGGRIPVGIRVEGTGVDLEIRNCVVHDIWQSSTNSGANGFGVAVYGTSGVTPISGLVFEGNEVYNLRTGQSESVAINGNVTNFQISGNVVHDCNNIGIDFIGYEGSAPANDRARDGVCVGNVVYNIDSAYNPGYGGDFATGGGDQSAAGIYVDGGTNIVLERNHCHHCNYGMELASEAATGYTDFIILRNNLLNHNHGAGLIMGGYNANRGTTRDCLIDHNVIYKNDTAATYGGQVAIQFYYTSNTFTNNIVWANPVTDQLIIHYVTGGTAAQRAFPGGNVFDYNLYYNSGDSYLEFGLNPDGTGNQSYRNLAQWRAAVGGETNSLAANPGFVTPTPGATPVAEDFRLATGSVCRDRGDPGFAPGAGEKDFFGAGRVANLRVDIGMQEWMTVWQAWRDAYFGLPDGGAGAEAEDDWDADGARNLLEFSQGMDPTRSDVELLPNASRVGGVMRFQYRKDQPSLLYRVESSGTLPGPVDWPDAAVSEQTDGAGVYWRDFPISGSVLFVRLQVEMP